MCGTDPNRLLGMSTTGWFPDPGGAPERYRYWDGDAWSDQTTTDPNHTPPPQSDDDTDTNHRRGGSKAWIIAVVALVVITAVVIFLALRGTGGFGGVHTAPEDTNSSTPTVSAWDETSSPSRTPPPTNNSGGQQVACPTAKARGNTAQVDGKLTADTLSVSTIPSWSIDPFPIYIQPIYDAHSQTDIVYHTDSLDWMSNIVVGLLSNADGFIDIATSAEQVLDCFASSDYYVGFTGRKDTMTGQQISISGYAAWHIQADIFVSGQRVPGDVVDVIVVDLGGTKDHLGVFVSACSIGDDARCQLVTDAIKTLAVAS